MDKNAHARAIGVKMYGDPWLADEIKGADEIYHSNGRPGLRLAARELLKDDHFQMNWWPQLLQLGGTDAGAKALLRDVIEGYVDSLLDARGLSDEPLVAGGR